ncbi:MAG: protein TolQ [Sphingobium sp.]|nr:protein TolQ [Sphingobium sp.]
MTAPLVDLSAHAATLSPYTLFMQADLVVKGVMVGLALASIWTWTIIIGFGFSVGRTAKKCQQFEQEFWRTDDIDRFYETRGKEELPIARVLAAGITEWRRSTRNKVVDREGVRDRISTTLSSAVGGEVDRLSDRLNILATIGAVAPFVGLFGTVWGIMRSFTAIAAQQNSSLAVVAPGIAEALFATAIGLFAAIPAVIAYNRFSHRINKVESGLNRFSDGFYSMLSRELEQG